MPLPFFPFSSFFPFFFFFFFFRFHFFPFWLFFSGSDSFRFFHFLPFSSVFFRFIFRKKNRETPFARPLLRNSGMRPQKSSSCPGTVKKALAQSAFLNLVFVALTSLFVQSSFKSSPYQNISILKVWGVFFPPNQGVLVSGKKKPINMNIWGGTVSGTKGDPSLGQTGRVPREKQDASKPAFSVQLHSNIAILSHLSLGRVPVRPWDD